MSLKTEKKHQTRVHLQNVVAVFEAAVASGGAGPEELVHDDGADSGLRAARERKSERPALPTLAF